jgi:hypothetical protein
MEKHTLGRSVLTHNRRRLGLASIPLNPPPVPRPLHRKLPRLKRVPHSVVVDIAANLLLVHALEIRV